MAELTDATLAWLAELNATIRADERAKVAEEIAKAIEATKPSSTRFWDTADTATVYALNRAAAIARQHAVQGSARHQEAPNGPDAYPSEGSAVPSPQKPAQEAER